MKRFSAYFFDFDGTIGDTEPDIRNSWLSAISKLGLPEAGFYETFRVGPTIEEIGAALFPEMPSNEMAVLLKTYKSFYDDAQYYTAAPYPGITDTLKQLHDDCCKIYIVTNKRLKPLKKLVSQFGLTAFCHGLFAPDIISPEQPLNKSQMLALALRISGVEPENAVMVGDTELDIAAGKNNNTMTCCVTWGYGKREFIQKHDPDYLINDPAELLK